MAGTMFWVKLLTVLSLIALWNTNVVDADNSTEVADNGKPDKCEVSQVKCRPGVILPLWLPQENLSSGDKAARAIVYFTGLVFMFLGISIIADRFMSSIEVITSKEREVTIRTPSGETTVMHVRIWNETVSNLTLMALGSSAPEIMLSVIEIIGNKFEAGDLGPGTIVGSAAFNLFVIIALCVYVIPDDEVRRIKHLRVFFITASWSIFAYLWLYLIIAVFTPGRVDIWEGLVTLLFFPITVGMAYIADRKIFFFKFLNKKYRPGKGKTITVFEGDIEMGDKSEDVTFKGLDSDDVEIREFEKHRKEFIEILRELRKKHPNMDMKTLEEMAELEAMNRGPKSRAFYRIQATRKLTGGGNIIKKKQAQGKADTSDVPVGVTAEDDITRIYFEPGHYTVMENVGTFKLTVARHGGDISNTVYVDYRTEDGTANAGSDYEFNEGTLVFHPDDTHKHFSLTIIDDDVFEEDEHFYVRLSNIRVGNADGMFTDDNTSTHAQLANPSMATIMILDDDHSGIFHFEQKEISFPESIGEASIKVERSSGARGTVRIPYHTIEGTAGGGGKDYMDTEGELEFSNDETEAYVKVCIIDKEEYEKSEVFYIELGEPILMDTHVDDSNPDESNQGESDLDITMDSYGTSTYTNSTSEDKYYDDDDQPPIDTEGEKVTQPVGKHLDDMTEDEKMAELGKPRLGEIQKITCQIRESMEFKSTVDKLLKKANVSLVVGTSSWREQFIEAISVSPGDDDDDDEDGDDEEREERLPSCLDYVMHFLTIFWKVLFAFVPPTGYWGGWAAFTCSIIVVGVLTAFVGDLASHFGCTVGLLDSVTSITFVALGTSVPEYWGGWACFWVSILLIGLLTGFIGDLASGFGCSINLKDAVCSITFVALGTSLPDTFASKVAAIGDEYADSSIGNVTGSNAVNVFLGIGIAWSIAAIYHAANGTTFYVEPGSLAFSVTLFVVCAVVAILVMIIRRRPFAGGELGGPRKYKIPTAIFFLSLWCIYIVFSSLESYCHIKGF